MKICLDAGHAGKYNRSPSNGAYYESEAMWKLHLLQKKHLEAYGFEVVLTRTAIGTDKEVYARGATAKGCALFISNHSNAVGNSGTNETADYPVVFVPVNGKGNAIGEKLAACIQNTMGTAQKGRISTRAGNNGDYYGVIRGAVAVGVIGVLIEHSFHTNTKATNWLLSDANLDKLAQAEADVIAKHFSMAAPAPTTPTAANDEAIWAFLTGKGLNAYAAAGVMGNLYAESGLSPKNLQNSYEKSLNHTDESYTKAVDGGTYKNFVKDSAGYGLAQWTFWSRKQALLDFAKAAGASIGDLTMQLNYLWKELQGYAGVMNVLKSAKSVLEASNVILTQYEKPADQSAAVKTKRAGYGQSYYDKFAGKPAAASSTPTAFAPYTVKVTADTLNIRKGAGTNYAMSGVIKDKGVYTIVEESSGTGAKKWGKLKSGAGWIALDYTEKR